eukprot:7249826-Lingulodinium_polyedra.AAC.1
MKAPRATRKKRMANECVAIVACVLRAPSFLFLNAPQCAKCTTIGGPGQDLQPLPASLSLSLFLPGLA